MEVKVYVDGIPRVVCGVTEETTCQEVVLALAQALGQPGRYTLREKFKDFVRCMMPDECLLETLKKYGEQGKEVQLSLQHCGPSLGDETSTAKAGRYQPCPPMRRKDGGGRIRRGSGSLGLHRQSLPMLSCLRQEVDLKQKDLKRPKRKSLTLMEEAWGWLESLGKGKVYSTGSDKESKKSDKRNRASLDLSLSIDKEILDLRSKDKTKGQRSLKTDLDHQTSSYGGNQTSNKDVRFYKKNPQATFEQRRSSLSTEEEKNKLRETIVWQLLCLQDLHAKMTSVDKQISELEKQQKAEKAEQEAHKRMVEEEMEQIKFWENELKAEERHEEYLQCQFLETKAKAVECKATLEEYWCKIKGLDFISQKDLETVSNIPGTVGQLARDVNVQESDLDRDKNEIFPPREDFNPPHALIPPNQIKERRPTGPIELRERWTQWSEARSPKSQVKKKIHRSELTIYLGSTKV